MSDETEGFPGLQVSTFVKGDQLVFRANTGADLAELLKGAAENIDDIINNLVNVKQGVIAKNVFTGESNGSGKASSSGTATKSTGRKATGAKAADTPPPSDVTYWEEDGEKWSSVECKHGYMKDLRDRGYKSDLYCAASNRKEQCPPVKL